VKILKRDKNKLSLSLDLPARGYFLRDFMLRASHDLEQVGFPYLLKRLKRFLNSFSCSKNFATTTLTWRIPYSSTTLEL